MRATFTPAQVHALALVAVEHWRKRFADRREAWIAETAEKKMGLFFKRPIGRALAEEAFEASPFGEGRPWGLPVQWGGYGWGELSHLETAERLARHSEHSTASSIILGDEEIWCLKPALEAEAEA